MKLAALTCAAIIALEIAAYAEEGSIVVRGAGQLGLQVETSDFSPRRCRETADPLAYFLFFDDVYAVPLSQVTALMPNGFPAETSEDDFVEFRWRYPVNATCREAPVEAYWMMIAAVGPQDLPMSVSMEPTEGGRLPSLNDLRESGRCRRADHGVLRDCAGTLAQGHSEPPIPVRFLIEASPVDSNAVQYAICSVETGAAAQCVASGEHRQVGYEIYLPRGEPSLAAIRGARAEALAYLQDAYHPD